jgi:hypothetical protein
MWFTGTGPIEASRVGGGQVSTSQSGLRMEATKANPEPAIEASAAARTYASTIRRIIRPATTRHPSVGNVRQRETHRRGTDHRTTQKAQT